MTILEDAAELINGDRASTYGNVTENFGRIADMWTAYAGVDRPFTAYDVSNMMILVKVARLATGGYHRDSVADIAGYAGLSEQIAVRAAQPIWPKWTLTPAPRVVDELTIELLEGGTVWEDRDGDWTKGEEGCWWRNYHDESPRSWFDMGSFDFGTPTFATAHPPYTEVLEPA